MFTVLLVSGAQQSDCCMFMCIFFHVLRCALPQDIGYRSLCHSRTLFIIQYIVAYSRLLKSSFSKRGGVYWSHWHWGISQACVDGPSLIAWWVFSSLLPPVSLSVWVALSGGTTQASSLPAISVIVYFSSWLLSGLLTAVLPLPLAHAGSQSRWVHRGGQDAWDMSASRNFNILKSHFILKYLQTTCYNLIQNNLGEGKMEHYGGNRICCKLIIGETRFRACAVSLYYSHYSKIVYIWHFP